MGTEVANTCKSTNWSRIAIAVMFLLLGAGLIAKTAVQHGDVIMYALGAVILVNGILRLRGKNA